MQETEHPLVPKGVPSQQRLTAGMLNVPMGPALELSAVVLALLYRVTVLLLPPAAAISRLLSSLGLKAICQVSEAGVSIICITGEAICGVSV